MYADPQAITVTGLGTLSLPRVGSKTPSTLGTFATADGNGIISVKQDQTADRFRREYRFTQKKIAADPISAVNKEVSASVVLVVDEPKWGFTDAELLNIYIGLVASLSASTNAKVVSLLGGEL